MTKLPDPITQSDFYTSVPAKRLLAWIIDGFITFIIAILLSLLSLGIGFVVFFGLWAVISFTYRVLTITSGSATWGMRFTGIELRTSTAQRFDFITALLHTIGTALCFSTGAQIVSIILMLFTQRGQGLPDLILQTTAVNKISRY